MTTLHLPWLELSILTPLIGAFGVGRIRDWEAARKSSVMVCAGALVLAMGAWLDFGTLGAFESKDRWDLDAPFFGRNLFVIDELSAPLLPLAALIYSITVLSTPKTKINQISFGWTLFAESLLLATLSCKQPWALIVLLSLATIPPWLEIRSRHRSTRVYSIHMGLFVALLIVGQVLLDASEPDSLGLLVGGGILTAAALLRNGVIPFHCWMSDLFDKATFGTALLYVTPMTGAYAVMRLAFPISPDWALQGIAMTSLLTALYAGGMALVQRDARRFFCFLFLSHSSLVLVGLELVTPIGLTGGLCVWLSVGLCLAGFGLTLRCVEARIGRVSLDQFHGLYESMPTLAALFLISGLAAIGFPGTVGFIGTELLVEGTVAVYPLVGMIVVVAAALNGIAILFAYFRIFTGARRPASISLHSRLPERISVLTVIVLTLGGGVFPQPGVVSRFHAASELMKRRELAPSATHEAANNPMDRRNPALADPMGLTARQHRDAADPVTTTPGSKLNHFERSVKPSPNDRERIEPLQRSQGTTDNRPDRRMGMGRPIDDSLCFGTPHVGRRQTSIQPGKVRCFRS